MLYVNKVFIIKFFLVDRRGIEPRFSEQLAKLFGPACTTTLNFCGEYRNRTDHLLYAIQML
jgi:hypothetical protein